MSRLFTIKYEFLMVLPLILSLGFSAFSQSSPTAQTKVPKSGIVISLIAQDSEYELTGGGSIPVLVRVQNLSNERVKVKFRPAFEIVRFGADENIPHVGNSYTGRVTPVSAKGTAPPICLNSGESIDYHFDIAALEVKDAISSIDIWDDIFKTLKPGKYNLNARIFIEFEGDAPDDEWSFISNGIIVEKIKK